MAINLVKDCSGCGLCNLVCPEKCIDIKLNKEGFFVSDVNMDKCINCKICEKACPQLRSVFYKPINFYIAYSNNDEVLKTTTSGGVAYELAKVAIDKGYKVCAVRLNKDLNNAEHYICDNLKDLEDSKGSKYIQSYTVKAFSKLFNDDKYIVFGTPCQIAAINNTAELLNKRGNLLLVDFFCHGVPTNNIWLQTKKVLAKNMKI